MFNWIVQYVLGDLPTWIWPAVAGAGLGVYFLAGILGHFPQIKPYSIFIRPVAGIVIVMGIFMYGGAGVVSIYQTQIKEMEQKVAIADQKSKDANALLSQAQAQKTKVIHDVQIVYKNQINQSATKLDADCKFDKTASKILNEAATNPVKNTK